MRCVWIDRRAKLKRIYVIAGAAALLAGLLFLSSGAILGQVSAAIGMQTTTTIADPPDKLMLIPPDNYSYFSATVPEHGILASTITMVPAGLNIFVMDRSNFTMFEKNQSAFTIRSILNQTSPVSLSLTNDAAVNETYYFVIQNDIPAKQTSDVLVHYYVTTKTVWSEALYLPYIFVVIGLALIVYGSLSFRRKVVAVAQGDQVKSAQHQQATSQVPSVATVCRFCGAEMSATQFFCPSCKKSQT